MKQRRVLTIGGGTQDIFLSYKNIETIAIESKQGIRSCLLLQEGTKIEASDITYATGGGATNSAASFNRLGFSTAVCCKLGTDLQATFIKDALKKEDVDLSYIRQDPALPTGISCILSPQSGNSTILAYRGANAGITESDIPFDSFGLFDQLYITSLSGSSSNTLIPICKWAQKLRIPIATNPGSSQLATGASTLSEALQYIDILILNSDEAKEFMFTLVQQDKLLAEKISSKRLCQDKNRPKLFLPIFYRETSFNLEIYFQEILKRGPRIVVVTNGKEGVYAATGNTIFFQKSIPSRIATTVGAGDAFGSCFVASIMQGLPLEQALLRGILNASSVISFVTAKEGLLDNNELEKRARIFEKPELQAFPL